jgi:molecular chaperone HscB
LFCPHCSKIQPPSGGTYFSVFGLKPQLNIDLPALEAEFHRLSRKLHPDRFARASDPEKQWSLADTALLNDAYRTLKEPLRRTEYLLKLEGSEIGEEFAGKDKANPSRVPADLLEEVFELNMQLDEMRIAHQAGEEDPALIASLAEARAKFEPMVKDVDEDLRKEWTAWDEGDPAVRKSAQDRMVALLDRRRYLSNLLRDVIETLGA